MNQWRNIIQGHNTLDVNLDAANLRCRYPSKGQLAIGMTYTVNRF